MSAARTASLLIVRRESSDDKRQALTPRFSRGRAAILRRSHRVAIRTRSIVS